MTVDANKLSLMCQDKSGIMPWDNARIIQDSQDNDMMMPGKTGKLQDNGRCHVSHFR